MGSNKLAEFLQHDFDVLARLLGDDTDYRERMSVRILPDRHVDDGAQAGLLQHGAPRVATEPRVDEFLELSEDDSVHVSQRFRPTARPSVMASSASLAPSSARVWRFFVRAYGIDRVRPAMEIIFST